MSKKSKKKNYFKEENIMQNNVEELNQNIEEITEVTEPTGGVIEEVTETVEEVLNSTEESVESTEKVEEITEEVIESTEEVSNDITENMEEVIEEDINPEVIIPNIEDGIENNEVIGKVNGFKKLYVRKEANKDSEPVGIVTDNDDLSIDINHSTDEFYKVITSNGLEGYCIKEFVKID